MQSNDERLRLAYGTTLEGRTDGSRRSHPEPEALVALAERSGSEAARLEVLDHVMACDACRRELDLIRASLSAAGTQRRHTWFRSPSIGIMAIAASLLIVAGVRLLSTSSDVETGPRMRGGSAVSTYPVRWLPTGAPALAWRPTADAVGYRLEVIDEVGAALVDSTLRDTSFVLADSLAKTQHALSWTVTATLGDGSTISSLPVRLVHPAR